MKRPDDQMLVRCGNCEDERPVNGKMMLEQLRANGMLKKVAKPDFDIVFELFVESSKGDQCNRCHSQSLVVLESSSDETDWEMSPKCERCKSLISPERLEIFPDTKRCMSCMGKDDHEESEHCTFCGGLLQLTRGNTGVSSFQQTCADCGKRN